MCIAGCTLLINHFSVGLRLDYLLVKWLHILSATIIFGTGIGTAYFMLTANLARNVQYIHLISRYVVIADWIFTSPAIVFQFFSGLYLMHAAGYRLTDDWLVESLILYCIAGGCWLPVVGIQIKMRDMAETAVTKGQNLPNQYWKYNRWWLALGALAFPLVTIIFWLMVSKNGLF